MYPNHEKDVYGWAVHTAQLLRDKKMNEVDFDGIVEELEEMGISNKHAMISRLTLVISHLLKWQFQPNMRGHSWIYTIRAQRKKASYVLDDNPSLKSKLDEIIAKAYKVAIDEATDQTGLDEKTFPAECPYTFEQIMNDEFYPE
jgi:DNA-binding protein